MPEGQEEHSLESTLLRMHFLPVEAITSVTFTAETCKMPRQCSR